MSARWRPNNLKHSLLSTGVSPPKLLITASPLSGSADFTKVIVSTTHPVKDLEMCVNWPVIIQIMASIGLLWSSIRLAAFELAIFLMWQYASGM
jgi:hypothetical protein